MDPGDNPEMRTLHVPADLWCLPRLALFPSQPSQLSLVSCAVKLQPGTDVLELQLCYWTDGSTTASAPRLQMTWVST